MAVGSPVQGLASHTHGRDDEAVCGGSTVEVASLVCTVGREDVGFSATALA